MKHFGLTLQLRDDADVIRLYKEHHQQVWPEVTTRIREAGIREMRIFLLGRRLFMYVESDDQFEPARDFAHINEAPTSKAWDDLMRTFQEQAPEASADEWWAQMEEVFDLNWPQHQSA